MTTPNTKLSFFSLAAKAAMAGADGYARRNPGAPGKPGAKPEKKGGGCTPCAAMARKQAAIARRQAV